MPVKIPQQRSKDIQVIDQEKAKQSVSPQSSLAAK